MFRGIPGTPMTVMKIIFRGQSWTADWLTFNNSYFQYREHSGAEKKQLLWMETDSALVNFISAYQAGALGAHIPTEGLDPEYKKLDLGFAVSCPLHVLHFPLIHLLKYQLLYL